MLLYGDPGVGKTSLAFAIAGTTKLPFVALNATKAGKKDVEDVVADARISGKVILFLRRNPSFQQATTGYIASPCREWIDYFNRCNNRKSLS